MGSCGPKGSGTSCPSPGPGDEAGCLGYFTQSRIVSDETWAELQGRAAPLGTVPQGVVPMRIEQ